MTKERFILLGMLCISLVGRLKAQETNTANEENNGKVGINTTTPARTLTIQNSSNNAGKPVLRLVGTPEYSENINSAMGTNTKATTAYADYHPLVIDSNGDVYKGEIYNGASTTNGSSTASSTIGVLTLTLDNTYGDWVALFDTGISYDDYALSIMSYSYDPKGARLMMNNTGIAYTQISKDPNKTNKGNYEDLVIKTQARILPPTVRLGKQGKNWAIWADYDGMDVRKNGDNTNYGDSSNGRWVFTIMIGKKNLVNFMELNFNMAGGVGGRGKDDTTYKAKLTEVLNKLN